ncbi:MAG: NUDIX hydrolase [Chloroflexota bacterium]
MTLRDTRYQGAILLGDSILLIKHQPHDDDQGYWVIPGGGREPHETEEECVRREMREETHLEVTVERLLLEEPGFPGGIYRRLKTYLCRPQGGEARPGHEPEPEAAASYAITAVGWFDLRAPESWDPLVHRDPFTGAALHRIRVALGYAQGE